MDTEGRSVTESQYAILRAAACPIDTPALPRAENHHELVQAGVQYLRQVEKSVGGQLGRPSGANSARTNTEDYADQVKGQLWDTRELRQAVDDIYHYPLRSVAVDTLNRQLRSGISDESLASLVVTLKAKAAFASIRRM